MNKSQQSGRPQPPPAQPPNKLPMPRSTQQAFQAKGGKCQNLGLIFDRYLQFITSRDCDWDMGTYPTGNKKSDTAKSWNLRQIAESKVIWEPIWLERWQQTVKSQHAEPFTLTPEWRFVTGLGEKNALENGFTFHRIYGFPVIHGSTLKGLARAVALSEIADTLKVKRLGLSEAKGKSDKKEKTPLQVLDEWLLQSDEEMIEQTKYEVNQTQRDLVQQFRHVFGTKESAGLAMFFDAMPAEAPKLEVDVMNVHYPEYYGEKSAKPPTDNQNPNPIPFLTLGRTPFYFAVGWRGVMVDNTLQTQAQTWLKTGLTEFGVGAKTATGYGYFGE